jgi:hypothetical protein
VTASIRRNNRFKGLRPKVRSGVNTGKAQSEHIFSGVPSIANLAEPRSIVRVVPRPTLGGVVNSSLAWISGLVAEVISWWHQRRMPSLLDTPLIRRPAPNDAACIRAIARAAYVKYVPRIGREPAPMLADYSDVAPVAGAVRFPNVMTVRASFPAKSVPEFIAYAKANPARSTTAGRAMGPHNTLPANFSKPWRTSISSMSRTGERRKR